MLSSSSMKVIHAASPTDSGYGQDSICLENLTLTRKPRCRYFTSDTAAYCTRSTSSATVSTEIVGSIEIFGRIETLFGKVFVSNS
jgi:hypothetical protein